MGQKEPASPSRTSVAAQSEDGASSQSRSGTGRRLAMLPETTRDDSDAGWGETSQTNDERLVADRPPHWG